MNMVPLPYSRVAVQHVDFVLNETELKSFLRGKEAWFETDYVVFRRGNDGAIVELRKENREDMFCRITEVGIVSLPDTSHWIEDFTVDTGNPSALAEKAKTLGIAASETLVVSGLYEHVNFIHRPQPKVIDIFDLRSCSLLTLLLCSCDAAWLKARLSFVAKSPSSLGEPTCLSLKRQFGLCSINANLQVSKVG